MPLFVMKIQSVCMALVGSIFLNIFRFNSKLPNIKGRHATWTITLWQDTYDCPAHPPFPKLKDPSQWIWVYINDSYEKPAYGQMH